MATTRYTVCAYMPSCSVSTTLSHMSVWNSKHLFQQSLKACSEKLKVVIGQLKGSKRVVKRKNAFPLIGTYTVYVSKLPEGKDLTPKLQINKPLWKN